MGNYQRENKKQRKTKVIGASFVFIVLMALVSMFSDMTHEGSNSINGAFLSYLGAPDMVVAVVGGLATLLGCSLRILTGYLADKTKRYWTFTIIGYVIDLAAVPLLALVPNDRNLGWILAVSFILLEKVGKSIKKPAKDTLVSFAATDSGIGKSFAFGELLDQLGAFIGPLILTLTYVISSNQSEYQKFVLGFATLIIPALISIIILLFARFKFKNPDQFEKDDGIAKKNFIKTKPFILFLIASSFLAIGFMDSFALISKSFYDNHIFGIDGDSYIPLLYSYAMLIDALAALFFGFMYDKKGLKSIVISILLTASYSFFIFFIPEIWSTFVGLALWGIGMGAEESIIKSAVTTLSSKSNRAKAFGTYELFYGIFSFGGSFLIGLFYSFQNKIVLCIFSTIAIIISAAIYYIADSEFRKSRKVAIN